MIALVADSNAQLPAALITRHRVRVVPMTVVVDGTAYLEGALDPDWFVERLHAGAPVSTAAPSPGQLAEAYAAAADDGASAIVSVHVGTELSGTLAAARLAAADCAVPVELVDSRTASFATGCCVWAAGEAIAAGAGLDGAAGAARRTADAVDNIFIVSSLASARAGGRLAPGHADTGPDGVPVLALRAGVLRQVGQVADAESAIDAMARYVEEATSAGRAVRVGVGDTDGPQLADVLADRLRALPFVATLVRYRAGPSVAAHTGPGSLGAVFAPL